jgi:hypothetical protein
MPAHVSRRDTRTRSRAARWICDFCKRINPPNARYCVGCHQ